jgi:hypothetical protein
MHFSNIISEPSGKTAQFVIFGAVVGTGNLHGTLALHLDFKNVFARDCVMDKESKEKSDFEAWTPGSVKVGTCVLGVSNVEFWRRKEEVMCYIPPTTPPEIVTKACECTKEDFICDVNHSCTFNAINF